MMELHQNHLRTKVNPEDFVLMHKDTLKSVLVNAGIFGIAFEVFNCLGAIVVGAAFILLSRVPESSREEIITMLVLGAGACAFGWHSRWKKYKIITEALEDKSK